MYINNVEKTWGYEHWIHNDEKYCGKLLVLNKDQKCSFHYHKLKTETFYVVSGIVKMTYSEEDDIKNAKIKILYTGDIFEVPIGLRHQFFGVENSKIMEFSTQHFEEDSYRIFKK